MEYNAQPVKYARTPLTNQPFHRRFTTAVSREGQIFIPAFIGSERAAGVNRLDFCKRRQSFATYALISEKGY